MELKSAICMRLLDSQAKADHYSNLLTRSLEMHGVLAEDRECFQGSTAAKYNFHLAP